MKKKNIINLIKYYCENNDVGFKNEAYIIADEFEKIGDYELSEYIISIVSGTNVFEPQGDEFNLQYFKKIEASSSKMPIPQKLYRELEGIINAVSKRVGINKFLFEGDPGTGKTEIAKHLATFLNRDLYAVQFDMVIDSKLGQTSKNITNLFNEIKNLPHPEKVIILFDEIDAIALDRLNNNDLREMGRATSTILRELDNLDDRIVFVATTNLFKSFDKALIRRFDSVINFNCYEKEDLIDVGVVILDDYLKLFNLENNNIRLFKKILNNIRVIPYPGDLKNIIKTSIAFSDVNNKNDYLKQLYLTLNNKDKINIKELQEEGFTVREIETLTGISKSTVSRGLKNNE